MRSWRANYAALWVVQFLSALGFTVTQPFIPLYVQELGVTGVREAAVWSGIFGAVGGLTTAVASPFWGVLADRHGRKLMVERATIGGTLSLAAMGFVTSAPQLVFLRGVQGMITGVISAVTALAASFVPQASLGFALGALQTAVALGNTVGPFVGGWMAALVGYRPTFILTALLLLAAGLVTIFFVQETFTPPPADEQKRRVSAELKDVLQVPAMPCVLSVVMAARAAGGAVAITIPLALQEMAGGSTGVSAQAGTLIGLTALAMATGALVWGRLGDRIGQSKVLYTCVLLGIVLIIPQAFVQTAWQLAIGQMAYAAVVAGLMPTANALIGMIGPSGRQGVIYGASGTALALGNAIGPVLAAAVIGIWGTRAMFIALGVLFMALYVVLRRYLCDVHVAQPV